jgi:hypothetical protein
MCGKPAAFRHELFNFYEAMPSPSSEAQPRENTLASAERQSLSAHHPAKPPVAIINKIQAMARLCWLSNSVSFSPSE